MLTEIFIKLLLKDCINRDGKDCEVKFFFTFRWAKVQNY